MLCIMYCPLGGATIQMRIILKKETVFTVSEYYFSKILSIPVVGIIPYKFAFNHNLHLYVKLTLYIFEIVMIVTYSRKLITCILLIT